MKLKEFLDTISRFQEFQLVDAENLKKLTRIDCLANSGVYGEVEPYLNNIVYSIGSELYCGGKDCYFKIMLCGETGKKRVY